MPGEQLELWGVVGQQGVDDGEFGLLLVMGDGAGFSQQGTLADAQAEVGQLPFELGIVHRHARRHLRVYRKAGLAGQVEGAEQVAGVLVVKIARGREVGQHGQHRQAVLGRGGVVGGEQRAAHNVAMLVDAVDPAARRVDLGKGAVGNAAAVKVAFLLVEKPVTTRPLLGDIGRRDLNAKIAEKAQYPLFRLVALSLQHRSMATNS